LRDVLAQFANTLRDDGTIDMGESFIDSTFAVVKGGGDSVGLTKVTDSMTTSNRMAST